MYLNKSELVEWLKQEISEHTSTDDRAEGYRHTLACVEEGDFDVAECDEVELQELKRKADKMPGTEFAHRCFEQIYYEAVKCKKELAEAWGEASKNLVEFSKEQKRADDLQQKLDKQHDDFYNWARIDTGEIEKLKAEIERLKKERQ